MKNEQIIYEQAKALVESGVLKPTGRITTYLLIDGTIAELEEMPPIHTFSAWKQLGYNVKKGEHAIAKFPIWKYMEGKNVTDEDGTEKAESGKMFMKMSAFFSAEQVEPITA